MFAVINNDLKRLCIQELQKHNLLSDSLDKSLVNTINYSKHLELLEELQKTAISWVAFNHKAKNEK